MDQEELAEKLDLTDVQVGLLKSAAVRNLHSYARQIYDFADEEIDSLPHDREDIDTVLDLFNFQIEWGEDGVLFGPTRDVLKDF